MKKKGFNQSVSYDIVLNPFVQKDGLSTVYMRVVIDRKKKEFNIGEKWKASCFNKETGYATERYANDPDVASINMVIEEARSMANRIKMRYFGNGRTLTIDLFKEEFLNYRSGENFMLYWKKKAAELVRDNVLDPETKRHQDTSYGRLSEFLNGECLYFSQINLAFVQRFNAWLRKTKKLAHNSCTTTHKALRRYMNLALDDKINFDYPYKKFAVIFVEGERDVLEEDELSRLIELYQRYELDETAQEVLLKFLFSCFTGLRNGDNRRVDTSMILNGKMQLTPKKTTIHGTKISVPLPQFAIDLIRGRKGIIFDPMADQTCNKWLKVIAGIARIKKKLTFRVSRDTFGTTFISLGGDVYTLKELMGHRDIKTTMIYIKLSEKRREKQMANLDKIQPAPTKKISGNCNLISEPLLTFLPAKIKKRIEI